jgi:hypothetical protein
MMSAPFLLGKPVDGPREPFRLEPHELQQPLWTKIEAELERMTHELREKNDYDRSDRETNWLRGQLEQLRIILRWREQPPQVQRSDAG